MVHTYIWTIHISNTSYALSSVDFNCELHITPAVSDDGMMLDTQVIGTRRISLINSGMMLYLDHKIGLITGL